MLPTTRVESLQQFHAKPTRCIQGINASSPRNLFVPQAAMTSTTHTYKIHLMHALPQCNRQRELKPAQLKLQHLVEVIRLYARDGTTESSQGGTQTTQAYIENVDFQRVILMLCASSPTYRESIRRSQPQS